MAWFDHFSWQSTNPLARHWLKIINYRSVSQRPSRIVIRNTFCGESSRTSSDEMDEDGFYMGELNGKRGYGEYKGINHENVWRKNPTD